MKVAFINDTFFEGRGVDTVIYELAKRLGRKHQVFVLAGETNIKEDNFKFIKIKIPKLFSGKLKDFLYFKNIKNLRREIEELNKKIRFDIINVHHVGLSPATNNFEVVYTWHGSPPTKNIFRKFIVIFFERKLKNKKIICISEFLKEKAKKINSLPVLISNGVDTKLFKVNWKDENYMLYVGRLEKHKRVEQLIKISKEIDFPLNVIGYGSEEKKLKKIAKKLNAPVNFLGMVSRKRKELIKNYQECSFFVSASEWECFGLIFLEAGACGKPSILYEIEEMPKIVLNNKTGFVVQNFNEFKEKAKLLKEDIFSRKIMGEQANQRSKEFDWDSVAKKYEDILKKIKK
jgi:glycosyltransferase involved in cell wall biosynthesis